MAVCRRRQWTTEDRRSCIRQSARQTIASLYRRPINCLHVVSGHYAERVPLAPNPIDDFISDRCFSLAVLAEPRSGLSSRPLLHYTLGVPGPRSLCSTEQGFLIVSFASTTNKQNRAFSVVGP